MASIRSIRKDRQKRMEMAPFYRRFHAALECMARVRGVAESFNVAFREVARFLKPWPSIECKPDGTMSSPINGE